MPICDIIRKTEEGSKTMGRTSTAVKRKYNDKTYDTIRFVVRKGEKERIAAHARELGLTTSAYIVGLIRADMEKE